MMDLMKRLWQEEEGQDLTEYALLLVLISMVAIVAIRSLGTTVFYVFADVWLVLSFGIKV